MTLERWQKVTFWPLLIASVVFIAAYSWQVIADLRGTSEIIARSLMGVTWVVFVVDYIARLTLAHPRWQWFRTHLFDLAVVALPALRPLRLLKAITVVQSLHRTAGSALRSNIAVYASSAAAVLIWIAALAVLDVERRAPGANITDFDDAVWWAFVTITTVGYGDYYPVSASGRFIAVLLMCGGVAVVGVVTATLASWVIERAAQARDDSAEPATRGQVRALARDVSALLAATDAAPAPDTKPEASP
jgi:voltage-gated potassium channel